VAEHELQIFDLRPTGNRIYRASELPISDLRPKLNVDETLRRHIVTKKDSATD
jgi:hypothetical protein